MSWQCVLVYHTTVNSVVCGGKLVCEVGVILLVEQRHDQFKLGVQSCSGAKSEQSAGGVILAPIPICPLELVVENSQL